MAKDCDPKIIDTVLTAATTVHKVLGPGLLESIYERALHIELQASGISASAQVEVPIRYKNVDLGLGFRLDLIVAGSSSLK